MAPLLWFSQSVDIGDTVGHVCIEAPTSIGDSLQDMKVVSSESRSTTAVLSSVSIVLAICAARTAANSSNLGMVYCLRGAIRGFPKTKEIMTVW